MSVMHSRHPRGDGATQDTIHAEDLQAGLYDILRQTNNFRGTQAVDEIIDEGHFIGKASARA